MNIIQKNFPNALTCVNILSGCVAIVFAFNSQYRFGPWAGWQWASLAIGIAAIADFLDGFMARMLHAYSDLGKQLDSLSDLVSFGVAPAMLLINAISNVASSPAWLCWLPLVIPVAGALRLARFNVDVRQETGFVGLPIPANAIFWIGWVYLINCRHTFAANTWVLTVAIILLSWLMISNLRLLSLKFHNYKFKENLSRWILIGGSLLLLIFLGLNSFCLIILLYLIISLLKR